MAKEVTNLNFDAGDSEDDFFGSMSASSQPSSATSAAAAAAVASPGSGESLFAADGDAGDYDDIFGLGDPTGASYGGLATQPTAFSTRDDSDAAARSPTAAAPAPVLEVDQDAADPAQEDLAEAKELNSPQLFGDDGGDFMAALSMRDPEPQPAPQPAYSPAPQPAPQPVYQPAAQVASQPAYQPAPQPAYPPASQPDYQPEQAVDPITRKLGFAVAQPTQAPVQPNAWRELRDTKGRTYYFNTQTQESRWDQPAEMAAAAQNGSRPTALDTPWEELEDSHGRIYYFNTLTEESRWIKPEEMILAERQAEQRAAREREEQERQAQASHFGAVPLGEQAAAAGPQVVVQTPAPAPTQSMIEQLNPSALAAVNMPKWQELYDDRDRVYYYNPDTRESRWTKPEELTVGVAEQRAAAEALQKKLREEQERQAQYFAKQPAAYAPQPAVQTAYAMQPAYQPSTVHPQAPSTPASSPARPAQQQQQQQQQQPSYPVHQSPFSSPYGATGGHQFNQPAPAPVSAVATTSVPTSLASTPAVPAPYYIYTIYT